MHLLLREHAYINMSCVVVFEGSHLLTSRFIWAAVLDYRTKCVLIE